MQPQVSFLDAQSYLGINEPFYFWGGSANISIFEIKDPFHFQINKLFLIFGWTKKQIFGR